MSTNVKQSDIQALRDAVLDAALEFLHKSRAPHKELMNPYKVAQVVEDRARALGSYCGVHRFGAYVLIWDVACPWYSFRDVLIEDLLIKAFPQDTSRTLQQVLTEDIPELARTLGAQHVFTGDTQGLGYMGSEYTKAGYKTLGTQHMWMEDYGMGTEDHGG